MLWFWISYILVTCAGIIYTIINIYVLGMKPMDENGMGEGYEVTKQGRRSLAVLIKLFKETAPSFSLKLSSSIWS